MPNEIAPVDVIMAEFGARIERCRISRDLTQDEVARLAGLSRKTISQLENRGVGTIETLARVLRALGLESRLVQVVPDASIRPMDRMSALDRRRKRVRHTSDAPSDEPWSWGDDAQNGAGS